MPESPAPAFILAPPVLSHFLVPPLALRLVGGLIRVGARCVSVAPPRVEEPCAPVH